MTPTPRIPFGRLFFSCLLAGFVPLTQAQQSPKLAVEEGGIRIEAGSAGKFLMPVPTLRTSDQDYKGEKAVVEANGSNGLIAKYPSGAQLDITLAGDEVSYRYQNVPGGAVGFQFQTRIPINFNAGGKFALGDKPAEAFPETKGAQIIRDGYAKKFAVMAPSGDGFTIAMPGEYQQVQDNRVFGWSVFMHIYTAGVKMPHPKNTFTFRFSGVELTESSVEAEPRKFQVDRFGQSARRDFPGKVTSDSELTADVEKQIKDLSPLGGPALDRYGGLAGSGEKYGLKKTGYFHVGKAGGRQVLVTPDGNAFFHVSSGIHITDDYTTVAGREKIYEWIPPQDERFKTAWRPKTPGVVSFYAANWIKKFGKPFDLEEWSGQVVDRLRSWGFNSAGAFSVTTETMKNKNFPYVKSLPTGKASGIPVLPDKVGAAELIDPFAPGVEEALEKAFAATVKPLAGDPLLIGWFQGNEQHFELLPKMIPAYKASKVPAKARLVQNLEKTYGGDIAAFNAAWNPVKPFASFDELKEEPLFIRSEKGAADMTAFFREYIETYYEIVTKVFRRNDPNHLLIGNRITPGTANNEDVVRIGGKYLDVMSVNYYTYAIEKEFLTKVHKWSGGLPIILSEWYYASTDTGLGGIKEVAHQEERAKAYRNYVEQAASLPFIVGTEWFMYNDQSITGRFFEGFNGEGNNCGLTNVVDRPYEPLVAATRKTGEALYDVVFGRTEPFVFDDPRFTGRGKGAGRVVSIPKALPGLKLDGSTTNWPGRPAEPIEASRLVAGGVPNANLRGDFRLCWDDSHLYFLIQVKDPTPCRNDREPKKMWQGDGVELFVGARDLEKTGSMIFSDRQILLGAGREPRVFIADSEEAAAACKLVVVPDVTGDGYVLEAAIPWTELGVKPSAGMEILFDVAVDNSDDGMERKQQLMWNGTARNSGDRGAWGRAKLVEN